MGLGPTAGREGDHPRVRARSDAHPARDRDRDRRQRDHSRSRACWPGPSCGRGRDNCPRIVRGQGLRRGIRRGIPCAVPRADQTWTLRRPRCHSTATTPGPTRLITNGGEGSTDTNDSRVRKRAGSPTHRGPRGAGGPLRGTRRQACWRQAPAVAPPTRTAPRSANTACDPSRARDLGHIPGRAVPHGRSTSRPRPARRERPFRFPRLALPTDKRETDPRPLCREAS